MQGLHRDLSTLTSEAFHGRGYAQRGDSIAAQYLVQRFQQMGLQPYNGQRLDSFRHAVVIFDGKMDVRADKRTLAPGKDYIVWAPSAAFRGKRRLTKDAAMARAKPGKYALVVPAKERQQAPKDVPLVIVEKQGKLTHTIADEQREQTRIILSDSLPPVTKKVRVKIDSRLVPNYRSWNVLGYLPGASDSLVVVTAHYDHLGRMGNTLFPGANDNASGTSMMLQLANYFSQSPAGTRKYSLLFIACAGEEAGLKGSFHFVQAHRELLPKIRFLLNIDLMGGGNEGITVVNGTLHPREFILINDINERHNYVERVRGRGKAANSDHYPFSEAGVPAFFIYTNGGVTAYHDINDTYEALPLDHFPKVFNLLREFLQSL